MSRPLVVAGDSHPALAEALARAAELPLLRPRIASFPDGETRIQVSGDLVEDDLYIVQTLSPPANEHVMHLLLLADALRASGARRVSAVIPYLAYARQDAHHRGEPRSANLLARLIESAGIARLFVIELHAPALESAFSIPVEHLQADSAMLAVLRQASIGSSTVVVAPDAGGIKRAQRYADALGSSLVAIAKQRHGADQVVAQQLIGDVRARDCLIVDDMASTGGTIERAAQTLQAAGAQAVSALFIHPVMAPGALERMLDVGVQQIFTSDTVPCPMHPQVRQASVAGLLAGSLRRFVEPRNGVAEQD